VVPEILFQRTFVLQQDRLGATPVATTHLFEATFKVVVEVALNRPQRDTGKVGDLLVRQTVTLQPQHFHLALDVRVQVFVTILRNRFQVVVRKEELPHGCHPGLASSSSPGVGYDDSRRQARRATSPRAEYTTLGGVIALRERGLDFPPQRSPRAPSGEQTDDSSQPRPQTLGTVAGRARRQTGAAGGS
jgi:hypothetical protein